MKLRNLLFIVLAAIVFCNCQSYQPTSLTVASYNLRNANGSDSARGDGWGQRYPVIAQIVQYHDFDIFGTQECFLHQLKDMKEALPGYDYIGVGRDDGKDKGEHSAIFYRTDKFDIVEKGDFWLSETPDVPSKGWDAVLPRICSWGHFKCKDTSFEFLFFNLHMDHIGKKARVESAFLVQEKMKELGRGKNLPAILTGDFNVDPDPPVLRRICQQRRPLRFLREVRLPICAQRNFQQLRSEQFYRKPHRPYLRFTFFPRQEIRCADRYLSECTGKQ